MNKLLEKFQLNDYTVNQDESIQLLLKKLDKLIPKTLLVVDENNHLIGTITDGDIRRQIILQGDLKYTAIEICNPNPYRASVKSNLDYIKSVMRRLGLSLVPKVDENGKLISVLLLEPAENLNLPVTGVLMAGGEGVRLGELTRELPKPMMRVNGKPVIESLVDNLEAQGINDIVISVRYKADVIESHFKGKVSHRASVRFLKEKEPLDSLGSLSLLPDDVSEYVLVMHADLVHEINLKEIIKKFIESNSDFCLVTKDINYQLPYGKIEKTSEQDFQILEKPMVAIEIYVGIMILRKNLLSIVPKGPLNILDLCKIARDLNYRVSTMKTREYWRDIGSVEELRRVQDENTIL